MSGDLRIEQSFALLTFFVDHRLFGTVAVPAAREVLLHDALLVTLEVKYLGGRRAQLDLPLHLLFFCRCGGVIGGRGGVKMILLVAVMI